MKKIISIIKKTFIFLLISTTAFPAYAQVLSVEKIPGAIAGDQNSGQGVITPDGQYVFFSSPSSNLVLGDTNDEADIFKYDRDADTITKITNADGGGQTDASSVIGLTIGGDGRYIVFNSSATNLISGGTDGTNHVYVFDDNTDTITLVSKSNADVPGNASSLYPNISSDGRYITFYSEADNLVSGDTNTTSDVFVYDQTLDSIERVSVDGSENEADGSSVFPEISSDGRYVTFQSDATNLVVGDDNSFTDVFVRDRTAGTTERVSVSSAGAQSDEFSGLPTISGDGDKVVFYSLSSNFVDDEANAKYDIFLYDRSSDEVTRINLSSDGQEADDNSYNPRITSDGRFIAYSSDATNLIDGDTNGGGDLFLYDTYAGTTRRINEPADGTEPDTQPGDQTPSTLSENGQYVVYRSGATNLVAGDTNNERDVFVAELTDEDGISAAEEKAGPNNGDIDEDVFIDSVEDNTTSFEGLVGDYISVDSSGDCASNQDVSVVEESSLAQPDEAYNYDHGVIDFQINCKIGETGGTAQVAIYFFGGIDSDGLSLRKIGSDGNSVSISGASISDVTIDGQPALRASYSIVDGSSLDEDGLANGVIVDPVGLASADPTYVPPVVGGGSSSGSRIHKSVKLAQVNPEQNMPCVTFSQPMKFGSKYGEVAKLQELLNSKGYNSGVVDGLFGPMTGKAVKAFQLANSLVSDGIVGPMTRNVLNKCN